MTLEELINEAVELNVLSENTTIASVKKALQESLPKQCNDQFYNDHILLNEDLSVKSDGDTNFTFELNDQKYSIGGFINDNILVINAVGNDDWTKSLNIDDSQKWVKLEINPQWCLAVDGFEKPAAWML